MITVTKLVKEESRKIFDQCDISPIIIDVPYQLEKNSEGYIYGTAFNILLDYEMYRNNYIRTYIPHISANNYDLNEQICQVINKKYTKENLNAFDLLVLANQENIYRCGRPINAISTISEYVEDDHQLDNQEKDFTIMKKGVEIFISKINKTDFVFQNPDFSNKNINIRGDGDYVINDILFEVKCVKEDAISTRTLHQLMIYYLLNQTLPPIRKLNINKFGYFNPLKGQYHIWEVSIPSIVKDNWARYVSHQMIFNNRS